MKYDILLKNGEVVDPVKGKRRIQDVALASGKVSAVEEDIPVEQSRRVIDVNGKLVTPGLIDLHTHVYWGSTRVGVDPDRLCAVSGVTTMVDAGSAGVSNFLGLRKYVIEKAKCHIVPFLNLSSIGIVDPVVGELEDLRYIDVKQTIRFIEENRDIVRGVKVRVAKHAVGANGVTPLLLARDVADAVGLPLMVHFAPQPPTLSEILPILKSKDILTHVFNGNTPILDGDGCIRRDVIEARKRGVVMDVGHGAGSFNFDIAEKALKQGFKPDTVSTDVHSTSIKGPLFDLPTTMSKFVNMGLDIEEVLYAATVKPAETLQMAEKIGNLNIGSSGDVAVFDLVYGEYDFHDTSGKTLRGDRRLVNVLTICKGQVVKRY